MTPRAYAHRLALERWHSQAEWSALEQIVDAESGWDPCSRWPQTSQCDYAGENSCGIPQADPCPASWRGRLGASWREQVRWLIAYIAHRYVTPSQALVYRLRHSSY